MNPYTPTAEQVGRFRQLIAHLRTMPPESFEFHEVYRESHRGCGSVGCAVGQSVVLWPELVSVKSEDCGTRLVVNGVNLHYWRAGAQLFGIDPDDSYRLFTPQEQPDEIPKCYDEASAIEVAEMLASYLELYLDTPSETTAV